MDNGSLKCVMVIAESLPLGLTANTAGVLAVTLGHRIGTLVGPNAVDGSGQVHIGIIQVTLPILTGSADTIRTIRAQAAALEGLTVVDFTAPAQTSRTYPEYLDKIAAIPADELPYLGIALYGPKKLVNRLTGNLPLLREPGAPVPAAVE